MLRLLKGNSEVIDSDRYAPDWSSYIKKPMVSTFKAI